MTLRRSGGADAGEEGQLAPLPVAVHVGEAHGAQPAELVFDRLRPGGAFLNLEHVASPTEALHHAFLATLDIAPADDDPSNLLAPVEDQLQWLRQTGFTDVDCHWKWRELALLAGVRPA